MADRSLHALHHYNLQYRIIRKNGLKATQRTFGASALSRRLLRSNSFAPAMNQFVSGNMGEVGLVSAKGRRIIAFDFLFITFFNYLLEELAGNGVQLKRFTFGIRDEENLSL